MAKKGVQTETIKANKNNKEETTLQNRKKKSETKLENSTNVTKNDTQSKAKVKGGIISRVSYLFEETDASYLIIFRILWGMIMAYEAATYLFDDYAKIHASFYSSSFQFKYYGFEWCETPTDPRYLYALMYALFVLGVFITIGFFYRTSAFLFTIGFGYMYMLEQAMYLNHFYLVTILSTMMIVLPCNCFFSVDSYFWPKNRKETAPIWCLYLIRAELVIVYTYAGICKINEDWLRAEPLLHWLSSRGLVPIIGPFLVRESTAYFMSYAGMVFDLIVGILLLVRPLRWIGIGCSVFFHCSNKLVFNIGIFPWMMLASTTFFFDPDWPRYFSQTYVQRIPYIPIINVKSFSRVSSRKLTIAEKVVLFCIILFLAHQILIPLRHLLYPGDVAWNEYGHQFSWRMKLRTKKCELFAMSYIPDINEASFLPVQDILSRRQYRKVPSRPDMIIQFAHQVRDNINDQLITKFPNATASTEVYIDAWCELNGRPFQRLTDPLINLSTQQKWLIPYPWVTELQPLPEKLHKGFPWNWEWNFNWLKGIDSTNNAFEEESQTTRYLRTKELAINNWSRYLYERSPTAKFYGTGRRN